MFLSITTNDGVKEINVYELQTYKSVDDETGKYIYYVLRNGITYNEYFDSDADRSAKIAVISNLNPGGGGGGGSSYTAGSGISIVNNVISEDIPEITITQSQIVSIDPLRVQLTEGQATVLTDTNVATKFIDGSVISSKLIGYIYLQADLHEEDALTYSLDMCYFGSDGVMNSYAKGLVVIDTTSNIATITDIDLSSGGNIFVTDDIFTLGESCTQQEIFETFGGESNFNAFLNDVKAGGKPVFVRFNNATGVVRLYPAYVSYADTSGYNSLSITKYVSHAYQEIDFVSDNNSWTVGYKSSFLNLLTPNSLKTINNVSIVGPGNMTVFDPTLVSGYDTTKTQTLKNINGSFVWVDDSSDYVELSQQDRSNLSSILGSDEYINSDLSETDAIERTDEIIGGNNNE